MQLSEVDKAFLIAFVEEVLLYSSGNSDITDVEDMAYGAGQILGLSKAYMDEISE